MVKARSNTLDIPGKIDPVSRTDWQPEHRCLPPTHTTSSRQGLLKPTEPFLSTSRNTHCSPIQATRCRLMCAAGLARNRSRRLAFGYQHCLLRSEGALELRDGRWSNSGPCRPNTVGQPGCCAVAGTLVRYGSLLPPQTKRV